MERLRPAFRWRLTAAERAWLQGLVGYAAAYARAAPSRHGWDLLDEDGRTVGFLGYAAVVADEARAKAAPQAAGTAGVRRVRAIALVKLEEPE